MRVRVDAAGQDQQAGSIDDCFGSTRWNTGANFLDDRAVDQQIGFYRRVGIDDGSVLDED